MLLSKTDQSTLVVRTQYGYRFQSADYPVIYRQFVNFYANNTDIERVIYSGDDVILLQVIVSQHLVEPTLVSLPCVPREFHVGFSRNELTLLRSTGPTNLFSIRILCSDQVVYVPGSGNTSDVCWVYEPDERDGLITFDTSARRGVTFCTFDHYHREITRILQEVQNARFRCDYLSPMTALALFCALFSLERINVSLTLPYEAFQLLENVRLKSIRLDVPRYTSQLREPRFQPGCEIENFIVSPNGMPQCISILESLLRHSRTLKRVRVDITEVDGRVKITADNQETTADPNKQYENIVVTERAVASPILAMLFDPVNINRLNVMIDLYGLQMLDDKAVVSMTKYMSQIYDHELSIVIFRHEGTLFDFPKIYKAARQMSRGNPFENMINYMWAKYSTIFDSIGFIGGFNAMQGGRFEEDTVTDRQRYSPLVPETEIFPIIRDKDTLRRIVRNTHGDNMSLSQIFTYLVSFTKAMNLIAQDVFMPKLDFDPGVHDDNYLRQLLHEVYIEVEDSTRRFWDVYSPDPYRIRDFFASRRVELVGMVHVSDVVFMNELQELFRVMGTWNTIRRIRTMDNPGLEHIVNQSTYTGAPLLPNISDFLDDSERTHSS